MSESSRPGRPRNRRGLLVLLLVVGALAVSVAYQPIVQVRKAEASASVSASAYYGTALQWGSAGVNGPRCQYGGSAGVMGGYALAVNAWYRNCRYQNYKGVCARLWRTPFRNGAGILIPQSLVWVKCVPAHTGDTTGVLPTGIYEGCTSLASYTLEILFLVSPTGTSAATYGYGLSCYP